MKDELFDELVESVRQGGAILRGDLKPSRWYQVKGTNQKKLHLKTPLQSKAKSTD